MEDKRVKALELFHMQLVDFLGLCIKCEEKSVSSPDACQIYTSF